jgi:hypothetical protein
MVLTKDKEGDRKRRRKRGGRMGLGNDKRDVKELGRGGGKRGMDRSHHIVCAAS